MLLGSALSIFAIASSTAGESMGRYSLPFQIPAILLFLGWLVYRPLTAGPVIRWRRSIAVLTGLYLGFLALMFGVRHAEYRRYAEDARLLTPAGDSWFDPDREVSRQRALQAAIPPRERFLAHLFVSYALDFRRNQIFLPDFTGMAGFRPGMPIGRDLSTLVQYLDRNNIHYIAYDYGRAPQDKYDPGTSLAAVLADPTRYGRHGWLYVQMKVANLEQQQLMRLAKIYPHVYDDGTVYVVHLTTR